MDSMFKSMVIFILFTILSLLSTSVFANTFYVKSYLLPVYQQTTAGQPFHQFRRGDQLQALQISREGWVQVKKGEVQGWVQQNRLSTKPVQSRISQKALQQSATRTFANFLIQAQNPRYKNSVLIYFFKS